MIPKILVVEDDFENQRLLQMFLKRKFEVYVCDSEESFYEKLSEHKFDIFLMDIALRGNKDGLQLTQELRKMDEYKNAPIICISAHVFPKDKANAYNAGVDDFLARPVYNGDLLNSLTRVYKEKTGIDLN
ncbi:MAG: response regulator [Ignavibacteriaceae bacterium]|nr:response regulator [Ignavibacteriaceae bacterium]